MKTSDTTTAQAPEVPLPSPHELAMQFTSTPRGTRLARRLVSHQLDQWGHPYDYPVNETLTLIAAELTSNAVRHGHVPGRDFYLRLTAAPEALRIEVTDTRTEQVPPSSVHEAPGDAESGRGLLLVARLATHWGTDPRPSAPGKTVWAELSPAAACPTARISAPASPDVQSDG
ncbi:ATP-binding protein [Streptomyces sp. NPDC014685]|uniref:ATP-binding protein n=1 Tax=Streptomyces sp. NPDC014685 TaxID=3364881 RepID=UPI0036F4E2D2